MLSPEDSSVLDSSMTSSSKSGVGNLSLHSFGSGTWGGLAVDSSSCWITTRSSSDSKLIFNFELRFYPQILLWESFFFCFLDGQTFSLKILLFEIWPWGEKCNAPQVPTHLFKVQIWTLQISKLGTSHSDCNSNSQPPDLSTVLSFRIPSSGARIFLTCRNIVCCKYSPKVFKSDKSTLKVTRISF